MNTPSLRTPRQETTPSVKVERGIEHRSSLNTMHVLEQAQPTFQLIHFKGSQTRPQHVNSEHNSQLPLIQIDFSQPQEVYEVDGIQDIPTQGNILNDLNLSFDITRDINQIICGWWRGSHIN